MLSLNVARLGARQAVGAARHGLARAIDAYLLRDVEKAVTRRSQPQQDEIANYWRGARRRIDAADSLSEPRDALGAVVLYREALILLSAALAKTENPSAKVPRTPPDAWQFLETAALVRPGGKPESFARLREALGSDDPLAMDAAPIDLLHDIRTASQQVITWLGGGAEFRSVSAVRKARALRVGAAAVAVLAAVYFGGAALLARPNVAKGRPATASSQYPGTGPASGVVNGEIETTFGVHTTVEDQPWVMVDLGKPTGLREVRVYNRNDGWGAEGLPLILETSVDGATWVEIDRRETPYTQEAPFVSKPHGKVAKFVRVRLPRRGYIAISEIQVFP